MVIEVILFVVGLLCLVKGGDWFVDGACGIAHRFNMPEILIGATVVSIGTTIPEVMVSSTAALTAGASDMAYGNAIGSIICNTALIAAITMTFRPAEVEKQSLKTPIAFFFAAAALYIGVACATGFFSRPVGIILLAIFVAYMILCVKQALAAKNGPGTDDLSGDGDTIGITETPVDPADTRMTDDYVEKVLKPEDKKSESKELALNIGRLILGAAVIAIGAHLLVDNGTLIAEAAGIPQSVIALTFVALGTSLPELVTAITALIKGHSDLSLGNVIGANLFNLVLVSGLAVTLAPFHIPVEKTIAGVNASLVVDIPVMVVVMLIMCLPALIKGRIYRAQGVTLLAIYAAYVVFQFV
ncbi:MAG: calcium/sodium antiporter [Lachnospiraceae bacterium]|nr:calcium/sodium antiporter [Lachnospiraceae bacterium]